MDEQNRKPLWYTFGNHMHWVDMEWLWGAEVLPSSVDDMLRFCREAGVPGNVNFDGVGYERMAAQHPEALAKLRQAVAAGTIEVVGASYGQPYGLFQGGESNVRQRVFGVRAVLRLLGARPRAFWEEEFDFYPQLPQILRGCGFESACLYFQWTWHTPELPHEPVSLIEWQGIDGSRLPALPRNDLNLHQWPEDFEAVLAGGAAGSMTAPALVQWLELMPSPDWMCRSELLLPELRRLAADPRFELRPRTLSALVAELAAEHARAGTDVPVRSYTLDDAWHGMSLGKNGDAVPRASRAAESEILAAESLAALAGLLGRPYPNWDVYPAWELEEAWRELLAAQHHDNHECEGLCGFIGHEQFRRATALASQVRRRTARHLAWRAGGGELRLVHNRLGWKRDVVVDRGGGDLARVPGVPAFGAVLVDPPALRPPPAPAAFPDELLGPRGLRLLGRTEEGPLGPADCRLESGRHPLLPALQLRPVLDLGARRLEPGLNAGFRLRIAPAFRVGRIRCDSPFAVHEARPAGKRPRKYPSGDWMSSEQWFEEVDRPFTGLHFVDLLEEGGGRGLLIAHDGSQQFFRSDDGVELQLLTIDPWDQSEARQEFRGSLWLLPHGPLDDAEAYRLARELAEPPLALEPEARGHMISGPPPAGGLPRTLAGPVLRGAPGVVATAFYREPPSAGRGLPDWAGHGLGTPFVLRFVEYAGSAAEGRLLLPGPAAAVWRSNLLGERIEQLEVTPAEQPAEAAGCFPGPWSAVELPFRPHEIVTVVADLVLGRKQVRDLDARREVWASVHRRGEEKLKDGAESAEDRAE